MFLASSSLNRHPMIKGGLTQRLVVALILVGVSLGEAGEGVIGGFAAAQIPRDGYAVAGAGMGPGEHLPAGASVVGHQLWAHRLDGRRALPVAQLAHEVITLVSVRADGSQPTEQDVAAGLHQPLPNHHPLCGVGIGAGSEVCLEHRWLRLLYLQHQWVVVISAQRQHHPRPQTDAAHTDDLAGHACVAEAARQ